MKPFDKESDFPDPRRTTPEGLLSIGGDLSPERLLRAYRLGIFPWFRDEGLVYWYCPPFRMVLFPSEIKISRSMKQVLNSKKFLVTENKAFADVIRNCSMVQEANHGSTWIDDEFISAYIKMHRLGYAHSIEVWMNEKLVGGLYGIEVGKMYCGESMFSKESNASKAALIHLCLSNKYALIDCQIPTPHLMRMGARMIAREEFLGLVKKFTT
ncbi:MAG: leucyl/phenylalanyl-tRNA--protein transferase [Chitinophagales bacterium]